MAMDTLGPTLPVLVVEDNDDVRASVVEILRAAGFEVVEAADGFIALEVMRTTPVCAVVLDLGMTGLDGIGVLDRLEDPPPVVVVTARGYDSEIMRRRDKIFGFVQKPVPPNSLIALVGEAVLARQ
jgi:DNA-binding response OmpR family regulator